MPKVVDVAQRREQIADAVFQLIHEGGIEAASLRNVAARTGLNIGSVRHYVDGHEGMLIDAVRIMAARVEARIRTRLEIQTQTQTQTQEQTQKQTQAPEGSQLELAVDLLEELLPLDDRRRLEVATWLAFSELSRIEPTFQAEARALLDGSRELSRALLVTGGAPDVDLGSESLAALVDGLCVALLHDPGRLDRHQVRRLLRTQLAQALGGLETPR